MRVRRCKAVCFEPREEAVFDLEGLLAGGDGVAHRRRWMALAPHLGREVEVDAAARDALAELSPERWVEADVLPEPVRQVLPALLEVGLAISDAPGHAHMRARDEALRATWWHPMAALAHGLTR